MTGVDQKRVRALFLKLIQCPRREWPERLDEACGDDDATRQAVQRLLEHHSTKTLIGDNENTISEQWLSEATTKTGGEDRRGTLDAVTHTMASIWKRRSLRPWITGAVMLLLFTLVTYFVDQSLRQATRKGVQGLMRTILHQQVEAIDMWLEADFRLARSWSRSEPLVDAVLGADEAIRSASGTDEGLREAGQAIDDALRRAASPDAELRYSVWNREYRLLADGNEDAAWLGNGPTAYGARILSRVLGGQDVLWLPTTQGFITKGYLPSEVPSKPGVAMLVPIEGPGEEPIGVLMIAGMGMQDRFERIMKQARFRDTGETYAIDDNGFLITESRFATHLRSVGLIEDAEGSFVASRLRVANPGQNSYREPALDLQRREEWPLTLAARMTTRGISGENYDGYPDYRGVPVVGAWAWLEPYDFGLITEVNRETAYEAMTPLRRTYGMLLALCGLIGLAGFSRWFFNSRIARVVGVEPWAGAYQIERQIGEGGLAKVYLANHALLKRPAAVKVLKPSQLTRQNLLRFEREVKLASKLTHPNTIAIYDFGLTKRSNFYCAMEYVPGMTLQRLLDLDGPQPPERVVFLLQQVLRSLREAHEAGLIHRDVKPQNVMLCQRGGEYDVIKVLDFGLAKEIESKLPNATDTRILVGTPLYIAPERIADPTRVDPRSDIFSVGVLAYQLLVGRAPHNAANSMEALSVTMGEPAVRPSSASPWPIPNALDDLVVACQARSADDRPQTVDEALRQLDRVARSTTWTRDQAQAWWTGFQSGKMPAAGVADRDASRLDDASGETKEDAATGPV